MDRWSGGVEIEIKNLRNPVQRVPRLVEMSKVMKERLEGEAEKAKDVEVERW